MGSPVQDLGLAGLSIFVPLALACSAASEREPGSDPPSGTAGSSVGLGGAPSSAGGASSVAGSAVIVPSGGNSNPDPGTGGTCAAESAEAELTTAPVDIIMVLDNSGSMHEEMGAVERNINENFAAILTSSNVDYRIILLSRHRRGERTTGESEANTSVCVTTPLSGLAACPSDAPVFSERFYQYGEKVESFDALNWVLDAYDTPPGSDRLRELTPNGYAPFLRAGAKKVILILTDDNEGNTGDDNPLTIPQFLQNLATLSSAHFGTADAPTFTFHSIIGLAEKADPTSAYLPTEPVQTEKCTGNAVTIPHVGTLYQELSILTRGLRFPICQFPGYDAVFRKIAEDVTVNSSLQCDFAIPPAPAGRTLQLDNIAVNHVRAGGAGNIQLGQAPTPEACQADAFYIQNDRVWLCPAACDAVKADIGASVEVLFTCENQLIVPR